MLNCVECGAPIGRAGQSCTACGARPAPGEINGTRKASLMSEDDDMVFDADHPAHRDDDAPHAISPREERRRAEPSFVRRPLEDDPTLELPAFVDAPLEIAPPARAHFVSRAIALAIDLVLLSTLDVVLFGIASTAIVLAERVGGASLPHAAELLGALVSAGSLTLFAGYFSVLHADTGQTLGKAALGIRVARRSGLPLGLPRALLRTFGYLLSLLPFGLGFLLALGGERRALHDRLAGSVVLRQRRA